MIGFTGLGIILLCDVCAYFSSFRWCSSKGKVRRVSEGYDSRTICIHLYYAFAQASKIFASQSQIRSPCHHQCPKSHRCRQIFHQEGSFQSKNSQNLIHTDSLIHPIHQIQNALSLELLLVWVLSFYFRFDFFDFYQSRQASLFLNHEKLLVVDAHFLKTHL